MMTIDHYGNYSWSISQMFFSSHNYPQLLNLNDFLYSKPYTNPKPYSLDP